ncbi:GNAT domain-containing protein [Ampelomyces quisqualis]|uniref:GNAT domain-containing protein n=1 Tax=Ampelomyces quisqualis TaxID=50730 RepID=A0A6A5QWN7_AMPQU|nr:GNAT domain-containing protein [Ampelomyces quisqualis]
MVIVDPKYVARTERLLLRPLRLEDAEDVVLMHRDPEVMAHTPLLPSDDLQKTKEWIQGCHDRDNNWSFAVELLPTSSPRSESSPRVIGLVGAVRAPEIGYMFNQSCWGKGYCTEALRAFMPMFFAHYSGGEHEHYDYAEAFTDTELVSSHNVLTKAGFTLRERREKDFENPVLGLRDTLVFRLESNSAP